MARILNEYDSWTEKSCSKCGVVKPISNFARRKNRKNLPYASACKECSKKVDLARYERDKLEGKRKFYHLKKYGISEDDYFNMLNKQNGLCKICKRPETSRNATYGRDLGIKALAVDHCHETGQIRALLCKRCNTILGFAEENVEVLQACIDFLSERRWDHR